MYGRLGQQGFTPLGRMAQALSAPPQGLQDLPKTETPVDTQTPTAVSGLAEALGGPQKPWLIDRDSQSKGDELVSALGGSGSLFDSDFISAEPGAMSFLGLSTGTAYDKLGRGYDTTNFDAGAAIGGLVGGLAGPVGGLAGGLLGRQADANVVLGATPNRALNFGAGGVGQMGRGERRAFEEARQRIIDRNRQLAPQTVSGASRAPTFNGQAYGDRGRSLGVPLSQADRGSQTSQRERAEREKGSFSGTSPGKSFK